MRKFIAKRNLTITKVSTKHNRNTARFDSKRLKKKKETSKNQIKESYVWADMDNYWIEQP